MQIIQKPDIVDKLRELGLQLTQKGKNWWACCPFHGEKTPSFAVNAEKQIFHCFGCQAHGDVIAYVQKAMNLPFGEACRVLGMRDNIKRTKEEWRKYYEEQRQCLAEVEKKIGWSMNFVCGCDGIGMRCSISCIVQSVFARQ